MWFTTPDVNLIPSLKLKQFQRLHSFRFDLWPSNSEEGSDISAPEVATVLDGISDARDNIEHLVLHGIDWLDPFVMWAISERFPNLRSLQFRQPQVWCGVCNTTGMPSFEENPMRIIYDDGNGLPVRFYIQLLSNVIEASVGRLLKVPRSFEAASYDKIHLSLYPIRQCFIRNPFPFATDRRPKTPLRFTSGSWITSSKESEPKAYWLDWRMRHLHDAVVAGC